MKDDDEHVVLTVLLIASLYELFGPKNRKYQVFRWQRDSSLAILVRRDRMLLM